MGDQKTRSTFVTVVSWIFIVITGFGVIVGGLQNIMIHTMLDSEELNEVIKNEAANEGVPEFASFMFVHMELIVTLIFLATLITFITSVGLLKRKNWARMIFIVVMLIGIAYNIGSIFLQQHMMAGMPNIPDAEFNEEFMRVQSIASKVMVIMSLGFSAMFAWIIKKLLSKDVRGEFRSS